MGETLGKSSTYGITDALALGIHGMSGAGMGMTDEYVSKNIRQPISPTLGSKHDESFNYTSSLTPKERAQDQIDRSAHSKPSDYINHFNQIHQIKEQRT